MDLPNLLGKLKSTDAANQHFLAIEISSGWVKTAILIVEAQATKVIDMGTTVNWGDSSNPLTHAVKNSLAGLEREYPSNAIFGLESDWVQDDTITKAFKPKIANICKELEINPIGFVVTLESIVEHYKMIEGGPLSAIIIHLRTNTLVVSIVKLGRLVGSQEVGLSQDISSDVEEGLARFPQSDNIPSRMIVYNAQKDLESAKQALISYDWLNQLPFLHIPKIETLDPDGTITAIAVAGGTEVAKTVGISQNVPATASTHSLQGTFPSDMGGGESDKSQSDTYETWSANENSPDEDQNKPIEADDFGFTTIDLSQDEQSTFNPPAKKKIEVTDDEVIPIDPQTIFTPEEESVKVSDKTTSHQSKKIRLPKLTIKKPTINLKRFLPQKTIGLPPLITIGAITLLALLVAGGIAYWYLPKATITVFVARRTINQEITATLSTTNQEINLENQTIPATSQTIDVEGSLSTSTTGTKTIGDRAQGRVAIYNRTLQSKSFSQGTTIQVENLLYTLDEDVQIASASTTEDSDFSLVTTPSSAEVSVTATDIGSQYNIPADTTFDVANFASTSFIARSVVPLTGGSSQQVPAVSQADLEELEADLTAELQQQAANQLSQQQTGVVQAGEPQVIRQEFSHQVGQQTDTISLDMALSQQIYTYNIKDINLIAQQSIGQKIPPNYSLDGNATQVTIQETKSDSQGQISVIAKISLKVLPIIDETQIARNITGKYPQATQEYISAIPGFIKADTVIKPAFPGRLKTLPRVTQNITIDIQAIDDQ